jgi:hypothetical protein
MVSCSLGKRGLTRGLRAISGPRPLVTSPTKLFVNFLLVTSSFIFFIQKAVKKIVFLISSAALLTVLLNLKPYR